LGTWLDSWTAGRSYRLALHPSRRPLRTSPPMALLRLHLLRPPPAPLAAFSSPWRRALPTTRPAAPASRLLCSNHPAAPSSPSPSIVGGLLDYLNESWTQFHATG
uniref:Uncharacterized protein n=1 Tax=Aegilops tauschii subsp. strangulata TaxID=200361 RepID=A0A453GV29_AEGTS